MKERETIKINKMINKEYKYKRGKKKVPFCLDSY